MATVPDQYPLLVELKCVNSLLELLSHDNTDISTRVVTLLQVCCILFFIECKMITSLMARGVFN